MPRLPLRPRVPSLVILRDMPDAPNGCDPKRFRRAWRALRADLDESINDRGEFLGDLALHVAAPKPEVAERSRVWGGYSVDGVDVEQLAALLDAPPDGAVWCVWALGPRWFVAPLAVVGRRTREAGELELLRARWRDEARALELARTPWLGQVVKPRGRTPRRRRGR